jgi:hypothetical protein
MKRSIKIIALFILLLLGCSKDDPISAPMLPLPPSTEGEWVAIVPGAMKMTLQITQERATITGTGTIVNLSNGVSSNCNLQGTNTYPDVSISIGIKGYAPMEMTGKLLKTTEIDGVLNKSGFSNFPITFIKQGSYSTP